MTSGSQYSGADELENGENSLVRYTNFIVDRFIGFLQSQTSKRDIQILDFGAGRGSLAEIWKNKTGQMPICFEPDAVLQGIIAQKGLTVLADTTTARSKFDLVYTSNVLEHIEDDVAALRDLRKVLQPGGLLAVYVPALPFLFSEMDSKVGHYRRYTKKELISKVESAGYIVEECYFNDSLGVIATLAVKVIGFNSEKGLGSERTLALYDSLLFPLTRILDKLLMSRVAGKNLFLFAKLPAQPQELS